MIVSLRSLMLLIPVLLTVSTVKFAPAEEKDGVHCDSEKKNTTSGCPPWSVCNPNTQQCKCATLNSIHCGTQTTEVLFCNCLTYTAENSEYRLGKCFYNCGQGNPSDRTAAYYELPSDPAELNEAMCGNLRREGTLCGQCQNDTSPLVYSYHVNCVKCPNGHRNWWKFILAAFGPLTIFYLIVFLCKVSITPGYVYSFVFYAQAVSTPAFLRSVFMELGSGNSGVLTGTKVIASLYGIWSLDFFRVLYTGICLDLDTLESQALEYMIALYPLLLIVLSYFLAKLHASRCVCVVLAWKPFNFMLSAFQRNWDTTVSLIDAYAVFFILSLTKIFYVSCDLLLPTKVHTLNSNGTLDYHWALYFDGSKKYFGKEHLPFALLAIAILSLFIVLPGLVLCLFPFSFFQRFLNSLHCDATPLRIFVDKFQGFFKNGRDPGTRDCRLFSLFHILLLLLMFGVYGFTLDVTFFSLGAGVMITAGVLYAVVQPYKDAYSRYNKVNVALFLLLALQYAMILGSEVSATKDRHFLWMYYAAACLCSTFPIVYFTMVVTYKVVKRMNGRDCCPKLRRQYHRMEYEEINQERSIFCDGSTSLQKVLN